MLLLPWLLRGRGRPEYNLALQRHDHFGSRAFAAEALGVARLLLVLVVTRLGFNALLRGPAQRAAQRRGVDAHHKDGGRLLEEFWMVLGNSLMLGSAMYVARLRNGGCNFVSTATCLAGWPNHEADPAALLYYQFEFAWYTHIILKPVLGYGLPDGRDMVIHHFASLALILGSYATGLTRIGVLVLATFGISNPLLHAAKICNQLNLGPLRLGGFLAFALAFFLSRVLLVPWAVLKPAMLESRRYAPQIHEDLPALWWILNGLLAVLYVLQLLWMRGIVRVIRRAITQGPDAASRLSAKLDPAKRYAVDAAPHPQRTATGNGSTSDGGGGAPPFVPLARAVEASGQVRGGVGETAKNK